MQISFAIVSIISLLLNLNRMYVYIFHLQRLLEKLCSKYDLQPRGSAGEHSAAVGAKWDISNKQRLGFSEVQLVQKMIDGVKKLIAVEKKLSFNQPVVEGEDY